MAVVNEKVDLGDEPESDFELPDGTQFATFADLRGLDLRTLAFVAGWLQRMSDVMYQEVVEDFGLDDMSLDDVEAADAQTNQAVGLVTGFGSAASELGALGQRTTQVQLEERLMAELVKQGMVPAEDVELEDGDEVAYSSKHEVNRVENREDAGLYLVTPDGTQKLS